LIERGVSMPSESRVTFLPRLAIFVAVVAMVGLGWWWWRGGEETDADLLKRARRAIRLKRPEQALQLADLVLVRTPEHAGALRLAGELLIERDDYDRAVGYLCRMPDSERPERITGMLGPGDRMDSLRSLSRLAKQLAERIEYEPKHAMANDHLAFILTVSGRRWEARQPLMNLLRRGLFTKRHLVLLGEVDHVLGDPAMLEACLQQDPDEQLARLGLGVIDFERRDFVGAMARFETVANLDGDLAEAHARKLWTLLERGGPGVVAEYIDSRKQLIDDRLFEHPGMWLADARFARLTGRDREAARCLWEAISLEPDLKSANYQLAQLLSQLGQPEQAQRFRKRAKQLEAFGQTLGLIETRLGFESEWSKVDLLRRAAEQCEEMGRLWEAFGWASEAQQHDATAAWAADLVDRVRGRLSSQAGVWHQTADDDRPTNFVDLSSFPRINFPRIDPPEPVAGPGDAGSSAIRFEDRATAAGVDFTYFNSSDSTTAGRLMFEYTGGGVAVLDYDRDGWPDLYFSQGCRWPFVEEVQEAEGGDPEYRDRLFRNSGDGTFVDVTDSAGLGDAGFSQGVSVGDIDHDGWPDLYVANIGRNRLYRNSGDGTFEDLSGGLSFPETGWTTSCLVADIDGDGHVDLYDVNYLEGVRLFTMICESNGVKMTCHPHEFPAAADRWWKGDGSGGFVDATRAGGFEVAGGKGLGIVAGGFSKPGRIEIFVANDSVPNFLFSRSKDPAGSGPMVFAQRAMLGGLAVDRDGSSQACMGVAAGDADGDGRLDLFVTNYFDESNTLYRQVADGQFTDTTSRSRLREPGWSMLGFGTQFLDADLDGELDLVVANGHVDDLTKLGQPHRMRPQFLRNTGGGRFVELAASGLGGYFDRKLLGRGLARVDFDRDGRDDFVVTHLEKPAALLANRSAETGAGLSVRLVATTSSRDAIGARVTVSDGDWRRVHFLTAGDGYMASNQRQLVIGLGDRKRVPMLRVDWPSGASTVLRDVEAGGEVVIVEGRAAAVRLPKAD